VQIGYQFTKQFKLSIGSNNVIDTFPDRAPEYASYHGIFQYDDSAWGINGRFLYIRGELTF
jgi:iron complex outermembrane receptor protein